MSKKPNIIFIITDQQRYDTINALGYDYMETPNLDRLVNEGVTFTNCYVTGASCVPARASLFKGVYPHTSGILKNADSWQHSWVENLRDGGYNTVNVGKMHTWPLNTPCGFNHRFVVENKDRFLEGRHFYDEWDKACRARGMVKQQRVLYRQREDYKEAMGAFLWELDEDMHSDFFVGNFAKWWLKEFPNKEPLFMQIGFPGPHPPYDPTPEYAERYINKEIPMQEYSQVDIDSQPEPYKNLMIHNTEVDHDSIVHTLTPTHEQRHKQRAYYLANVTMIDEKIGEIMQTLEEEGYLEDSIIVFTSDHGDCLTDHGHTQKWTMYDQVNRMPCIVWAPKYFEGGRKIDTLIQQMDLAPMLLEMAGVEIPQEFEAKSVLPLLRGEQSKIRDYVFCEQGRDDHFETCDFMTMVRDERYKLTHFVDREDGLLFDLKHDPNEMYNLWDDPNYAEIKIQLIQKICNWRISSGYHTRRMNDSWR